jgi:hypothetical protein
MKSVAHTPDVPPGVEAIPQRRWVRLGVSFLALGAGAWVFGPRADPDGWWVHGLFCVTGLALAAPTLLLAFRRGFVIVLTDHRMIFLASFTLYFLFGAALLAFGPEREAESALSFYPIGPSDALRADAVNGLGFGLALLVSATSRGRALARLTAGVAGQVSRLPATWVIGSFLLIGASATLYRLPFDLGLRPGFPSGFVRTLGQLSLVAIFMAVASRGAHERMLRFFGILLAFVLSLAGVLQFMKSEALMPAVALTAGLAMRYGSRRVLPVGLLVLVLTYVSLGNLVDYGRVSVGLANNASTLVERWAYLKDGWANASEIAGGRGYAYWGRLCYVPTQAASLDFQDQDNGGDGLELIPWVAVPRFLAPNKPQITRMFTELNEKISGSNLSSTAPGIFASGYYHGGWFGMILASVLCGWILAQTSAIARVIYVKRAVLLVPLAMLGMFIAFRIDGDFVPDYLGAFMFVLYPLAGAAVWLRLFGIGRLGRPRRSETVDRPAW